MGLTSPGQTASAAHELGGEDTPRTLFLLFGDRLKGGEDILVCQERLAGFLHSPRLSHELAPGSAGNILHRKRCRIANSAGLASH